MPTDRVDKVNSLLQHEIGKILLRDFAFSPDVLVSITRVDCSANLIEAKVYISVYPEEKSGGIMNALEKSVYDIQHQINRALRQRPIPKIIFKKDENISKAARIEDTLARLKKEEK